jgi:hypothetical protein
MPMMGTEGPAALRSFRRIELSRLCTPLSTLVMHFALIDPVLIATHCKKSFPPMSMVTSATDPRFLFRKVMAAAIWDFPARDTPGAVEQGRETISDLVVAPEHAASTTWFCAIP